MNRLIDSPISVGIATGLLVGVVAAIGLLTTPGAAEMAPPWKRPSIRMDPVPPPLTPCCDVEPPAEPTAEPVEVIRVVDVLAELPPDPVRADTAAWAISRIFVSEAGWDAEGDYRAIFGVLANIRRRGETWLHVARRASPRATGLRPNRRPRGRMIATLLDSDAEPAGWIPCRRGRPLERCSGAWDTYVDRWASIRALAAELVAGAAIDSPCPGRPIAWGGIMDDWLAERRGLERVTCRAPTDSGRSLATLNRFWIRPET